MYCKKCGESLQENSKFCMKCGTKVDEIQTEKPAISISKIENNVNGEVSANNKSVNATQNLSSNINITKEESKIDTADASKKEDISNKKSAFHVQKEETSLNNNLFSNTAYKTAVSNENSMKNNASEIKTNNKNTKKTKKLNKKILIPCIVIGAVLLAALISWLVYDNVFSVQAKYKKGVNIYNEMCQYTSTSSYSSDFVVDKYCMDKFDEAINLFKEVGDYEDAKLYYYCFRAISYVYKTNGNWSGPNTSAYMDQAAKDLDNCVKENLVNSKLTSPSKESEKFYLHAYGVSLSAIGYMKKNKEAFDDVVSNYRPWLGGDNEDYGFAGIKAITYAAQALSISLGKQ